MGLPTVFSVKMSSDVKISAKTATSATGAVWQTKASVTEKRTAKMGPTNLTVIPRKLPKMTVCRMNFTVEMSVYLSKGSKDKYFVSS